MQLFQYCLTFKNERSYLRTSTSNLKHCMRIFNIELRVYFKIHIAESQLYSIYRTKYRMLHNYTIQISVHIK